MFQKYVRIYIHLILIKTCSAEDSISILKVKKKKKEKPRRLCFIRLKQLESNLWYLYLDLNLSLYKSYILCQNLLKGKSKDETMMDATGNLLSEYVLYGAKLRAAYKYKHTFSVTFTFESVSMNNITLYPPNRILMETQTTHIQRVPCFSNH